MDPATAIGLATAAFGAIKRGIEVGRDLESMSSDLSRWMGAIGSIKEAEKKAKNPPLLKSILSPGSVEQEAIEAFAAKKKVEAMELELKTFINFHYGMGSWNEILRMQADIRKKRKADQLKKENIVNDILIGFGFFVIAVMIIAIVYFVLTSM